MSIKTIHVAAIQMDALFGQRDNNLARASTYIQQAAKKHAQLILLPEFLPNGYGLNESVWEGAEPIHGPSVNWLKEQAKTHNTYIGFTFLETDGTDFFNTFVLTNPEGEIAGQVRKTPAPAVESYFYKSGEGSHVIETDLGRIGVNICYEVLLHERVNDLYESDIDLCLQPCAGARPKPFLPGDQKRLEEAWLNGRKIHHKALGVPIIMANRVGKIEGRLPSIMGHLKSSFLGGSYISDSNGQVLKEMDTRSEEGVIVSQVTLAPKNKPKAPPKKYGKIWAIDMPWLSFLYPLTQPWGDKAYSKSSKRRAMAQKKYLAYTV
ncbi:carbon-nitrogen hydrolase family protein [Pseudomonadota bacterium]